MHPVLGAGRLHPSVPRHGPRDAVAHIDEELGSAALRMMEVNMRADVVDVGEALDVLTA